MMKSTVYTSQEVRGIDAEKRIVTIKASDFSLDSYGTRIDPKGWQLDQFKRNPVICTHHESSRRFPVATAIPESIRVEGDALLMEVRFASAGVSEEADLTFGLIKDGILKAVSVGFDPVEWEDTEEKLPDGQVTRVRIYRRQKLMEVSFVTIPSNDNSLVVRSQEAGFNPDEVRARIEKLEASIEKAETEDQELLSRYTTKHIVQCVGYFERKQPSNKEATRVLKAFFTKVLRSDPPADETEAWQKVGEAVEAMEEVKEEAAPAEVETPAEVPTEVKADEVKVEEKAEEPTPAPIPQTPADPEPARAALVQVPISFLRDLSATLQKSYTEAAVEALRRGTPFKEAGKIIDGANQAAISHLSSTL